MSHTSLDAPNASLDVIVIGAGQAGLALGYHLARRSLSFAILDAGPEIGHSWRTRWDSLRLFTPAEYDALPGLAFPGAAGTHPGKDDVADYLSAYAEHFRLPVRLHSPVTRVRQVDEVFAVTTPAGTLHSRQVVVATGPFQVPFVPPVAGALPSDVLQLHSADYRNPGQLPSSGRVLVVGAGNSGLQIAAELNGACEVIVAVGSRSPQLPQRPLGRDLFFWLTKTGVMRLRADSRLAQRMRARGDVVVGSSIRRLRRRGVEIRPRLAGFTGRTALFADGSAVDVDSVIWATGYRSEYGWLDVPGVVVDGEVRHSAGVTAVPGLYFLGLPWQTTRGSALLGFVAVDAAEIDVRMAAERSTWPSRRGAAA